MLIFLWVQKYVINVMNIIVLQINSHISTTQYIKQFLLHESVILQFSTENAPVLCAD